jgi:hypothetical protein
MYICINIFEKDNFLKINFIKGDGSFSIDYFFADRFNLSVDGGVKIISQSSYRDVLIKPGLCSGRSIKETAP